MEEKTVRLGLTIEQFRETMDNAKKSLALVERIEACVKDEYDQPLICYGCAHSIGYGQEGADFPGAPSGERPCHFCVRNPKREEEEVNVWYDGSQPVEVPMDCYHSIDMLLQMEEWEMKGVKK
jgi:hypothetical protein